MVSFIPNLAGQSYEEKLDELGLHTLKYRRDRADMVTVYRWIKGIEEVKVSDLFDFYRDTDRNTRVADYGLNIIPKRSRTEVRRNAFTTRVAEHWNRLPPDVKNAPSQTSFRSRYDNFKHPTTESN